MLNSEDLANKIVFDAEPAILWRELRLIRFADFYLCIGGSEITNVNNSQLSIENILTNINWCLVDLTYMRKVSRVDWDSN